MCLSWTTGLRAITWAYQLSSAALETTWRNTCYARPLALYISSRMTFYGDGRSASLMALAPLRHHGPKFYKNTANPWWAITKAYKGVARRRLRGPCLNLKISFKNNNPKTQIHFCTKFHFVTLNIVNLTHRGPVDLRKWAILTPTILMSPKSWLSQEDLDAGCEHSLVPMHS